MPGARLDEKFTASAAQVCHDAYRDGDFQAAWRNRPGDGSRRDHNWNFGLHVGTLADQSVPGKNPVAAGVAIGTASHAVGTSKAVEIGETEGAMSGIAIGISGIYCAAGHAAALIFYRKSSGWSGCNENILLCNPSVGAEIQDALFFREQRGHGPRFIQTSIGNASSR